MRPVPELVEYIRSLCKENGTSLTKLEEELHFANGTIGRWKTGKRYPAHDKLLLIAKRFNISLSDLTQESEQKEKPTAVSGELDEALAKRLQGLTDQERGEVASYVDFLLSKRNKA